MHSNWKCDFPSANLNLEIDFVCQVAMAYNDPLREITHFALLCNFLHFFFIMYIKGI